MQVSYSRVATFHKCPFQFKLRYIDKLETFPKLDDPANPLILGHALHTGIEKDIEDAVKEYHDAFPVMTDLHVHEEMKLRYRLKQCKEILPEGLHETKIEDPVNFIGFIDLLVPVDEFTFDLYDFKYSNNVKNYMTSEQLHVYKFYFELLNPGKIIRNLYFLFVPKVSIRQKKTENLMQFRKRLCEELNTSAPQIVKVDYDIEKVKDFLRGAKHCREATQFPKVPTRLCDWCDYQRYCEKEDDLDIMALPSTQRRTLGENTFKKIWIYGLPFSGKTYLANQFETPLMLNTDGNFKQVDAPVMRIIDEVTTEGRMTKRKYAWDVFKDAVDDLEKGSEFKTVILDLTEDIYDACRIKVCVDNGWDHESDDSFKAYDIVRSEFIRTMKRLLNLDYNFVLLSHEDATRDITKKSGNKITSVKPNIPDKVALKLAGMVDICCRLINDEGKRTISFKANEFEFGGGRLTVSVTEIPCTYDALMQVYHDASKSTESAKAATVVTATESKPAEVAVPAKPVETATAEPAATETPERKTRTRKKRDVVEDEALKAAKDLSEDDIDQAIADGDFQKLAETQVKAPAEEKPVRRRRRGA